MQRNFEPMRKQVGAWQKSELTDVTAKVVIYEAFVEGRGVFRMHSLPRSRNWSRSRNSRLRPSWANSGRPSSHRR